MKNKDIHEWLLDEGIDPLTTVTTEKGEYYLSDILEKHLTEQLRLFAVSGQSEQLVNFLLHLNDKELINNHDFDYEKEAKNYLKKIN